MKRVVTYIREFGIKLFFIKVLIKIFKNNCKIKDRLINQKDTIILKKLYKENSNYIKKYDKLNKLNIYGKNVWILWWQGEENAPIIVKNCIQSVRKYTNNLIVITKDNYNSYVNIDNNIISKFKKGIITIQNLSDIIRMNLLSNYGGYWVDATIYLTDNVFDSIMDWSFFSPKSNHSLCKNISNGKWCGFFIGGYDVILYRFMRDCFNNYWKKHNIIIDYFLIDYLIELAYRNINSIRNNINLNQINNQEIYSLNSIKNEKYNYNIIKKITSINKIHKLTYKDNLNVDDKNNNYNKYIKIKEED